MKGVHEDPCKPGSPSFAAWPATKWPWFGELAARGYLIVAVHRGKNLLVTDAVARLLDPICRAEIERMRAADRGSPASGSSCRRRTIQRRRPAHRARAQAAGAEVAAGTARAVRRDHLALAAGHRRRGTPALPSCSAGTRPARGPAEHMQTPAGRSRTYSPLPRLNRRTRARAAPLVLLAVVLDRHARRQPSPRRAAAQGGRSRHDGRPGPARRRAGAPGHIRGLRLKSPTVNFSGGQEPPERLLTSGC